MTISPNSPFLLSNPWSAIYGIASASQLVTGTNSGLQLSLGNQDTPTTLSTTGALSSLAAGTLVLATGTTGKTVTLRGNQASDISGNIVLTLPKALPAETVFVLCDTNGNLTFGSGGSPGAIETINGTANQITSTSSGLGTIITLSFAAPFQVLGSGVTAQTIAAQQAYIPTNALSLVVFTLPTTMEAGSVFRISGFGSAGWKIAQLSGQSISMGNQNTTIGTNGSLASTNAKDCVEIVCVVANTTFLVISSIGNITIL